MLRSFLIFMLLITCIKVLAKQVSPVYCRVEFLDENIGIRIASSTDKQVHEINSYRISKEANIKIFKTHISLYLNTIKNVCLEIDGENLNLPIHLYLQQVGNLKINANLRQNISIYNSVNGVNSRIKADSICINQAFIQIADFQHANIRDLCFTNSRISFLNLKDASISRTFALKGVRLDSVDMLHTLLPDVLI